MRAAFIDEGLRDLASGVESVSALLVLVGAPRLRELGYEVPDAVDGAEQRLYDQLAAIHGDDTHSQYNAWIRRLVRFARAAERVPVTERRLRAFMTALACEAIQEARIYLSGGTSAVLLGWRDTTPGVDLKIVGAHDALLRGISALKASLQLHVELASPDHFIPALPGWQDRSPLIAREGPLSFHHYDFYAQALAKLERNHAIDRRDVRQMIASGLIVPAKLVALFERIEPELYRFPAIHPPHFAARVRGILSA